MTVASLDAILIVSIIDLPDREANAAQPFDKPFLLAMAAIEQPIGAPTVNLVFEPAERGPELPLARFPEQRCTHMIAVPAIVFFNAMGVDCRADTIGQRFRAAG